MSEAVDGPSEQDPDEPADAGLRAALASVVGTLRDTVRHESAVVAEKLRQVAMLGELAEQVGRLELAGSPRVSGQPDDSQVLRTAVLAQTAGTLGCSEWAAGDLLDLSRQLVWVLPDTLEALAQGRIDLGRARALAEVTASCDYAVAREVERTMLATLDTLDLLNEDGDAQGPWAALSPRAWRDRAARTLVRLDPATARERRERAVAGREVRAWPEADGMGVLRVRAAAEQIALAERTIQALAQTWATTDEHGRRLSMDQRRTDAVLDLLRRARDGECLDACAGACAGVAATPETGGPAGECAETGDRVEGQAAGSAPAARGGHGGPGGRGGGLAVTVVLPADTLFGDGPARDDPATLAGLGRAAPLDPHTARDLALGELARGTGLTVLLTARGGQLLRVLHLPGAAAASRQTLRAAVQQAMRRLRPLTTTTYTPTATILEHVHARNPHCTAYDCPRVAAGAELDHDTPWPRGPTDADNLQPRCKRHHQVKTSRLVLTALAPDGSVTTWLPSGHHITTRPEPLPGHLPGEGYDTWVA